MKRIIGLLICSSVLFLLFNVTASAGNEANYSYCSFKNDFKNLGYKNTVSYKKSLSATPLASSTYNSSQFLSDIEWDENFTSAAIINGVCLTGIGLNAIMQKPAFSTDNYIYVISFQAITTSVFIWNHYRE